MTPTPTPPADPAADPISREVVEFVRTQRQTAAYVLLGLAAVFLAAALWWLAGPALRTIPPAADKPVETKLDKLDALDAPDLPKPEIADPRRADYLVGLVGAALAVLVAAGGGAWLLGGTPRPTPAGQRTEARVVLLAVGGVLGFGLIVFGGWYFYLWRDALTGWLDKGEWKDAKRVVAPLLMVVGGAGLAFLAIQPARAEERNNTALRRLVYGSNFGLTVLLLLVLLVVANVVVALKVPSKLDTTEGGFYTLSDGTRAFLARLPEPVTLYVVLPESGGREVNDIRQFADSAREAGAGRLVVKFVSPTTARTELTRLQEKYPRLGRDALGLLLTTGEDEKRNAFIPAADLFDTDRAGEIKGFAGEGKVMKELRFLADNESKPVVYFVQGHGELALGGGPAEAAVGGSAAQLKGFLEKGYLDVRPLVFTPQNPAVPDDAAVVVVAEPQSTLPEAAVGALRKYMTTPRKEKVKERDKDGKETEREAERKGKLIVLAGASGPDDKVVRTGLEGLLAEFNVRLGDKYVYSDPLTVPQASDYRVAIAVFAKASEQNPIVQTVGKQLRAVSLILPREVTPTTTNPAYQAVPLLLTLPGRETWVEDEKLRNPQQAITDLLNTEAIQQRKLYTASPRVVAAVVTEGGGGPRGGPAGAGRVVVFGGANVFTDEYALRSKTGTPATFELMPVAIDWLRDKPPLATTVESKTYIEYKFPEPAAVDYTRLLYLPLGLGLLVVAGLGTGVWVMRRQ